MKFWVALFNQNTWKEFRQAGSNVAGFTETKIRYVNVINPSDVFLCYVTGGFFCWVGALEVLGVSKNERRIWTEALYPVRFDVKPIVELNTDNGLLMKELEGKVEFYRGVEDVGKYKFIIRTSLGKSISSEDGTLMLKLLKNKL